MNKSSQYLNADEWELIPAEEPPAETYGQSALRNTTRMGTNIASMAGLPKDILGAVQAVGKTAHRPKTLEQDEAKFEESIKGETPRYQELLRKERKELDTIPGRREATEKAFSHENDDISFLPGSKDIKNAIASQLPEGYLETQGKGEEILDRMSTDVPLIIASALTGGIAAIPGMIARSVVTSGSAQAAKELGFGPWGELVAGIGAGLLYDVRKGFGTQTVRKGIEVSEKPKLDVHLKEVSSDLYDEVKTKGQNIPISGTNTEASIQKEIHKLKSGDSGLTGELKDQVLSEIQNVDHMILNGEMNLTKAIDKKQHLNKLTGAEHNGVAKDYYMRAVGAINEGIQDSIGDNPELIAKFNAAENITKSINKMEDADGFLRQVVSKAGSFIKNPTLKSLLGLSVGTGSKAIVNMLSNIDGRTFRILKEVPEARDYLSKIVWYSMIEDKQNLLKNLRSLDNALVSASKNNKKTQYLNANEWELI